VKNENFTSKRVTRSYRQTIFAAAKEIFPLLCPVREADWLDGWQYEMIYSESGLAEEGAVFSTPHHDTNQTIWIVTKYDTQNYVIEFARFTPESRTCILKITVTDANNNHSHVDISYTYTALTEMGNSFIDRFTQESFLKSVQFWEDAMNHYIRSGKKLQNAH
jgi:hypothetical protein